MTMLQKFQLFGILDQFPIFGILPPLWNSKSFERSYLFEDEHPSFLVEEALIMNMQRNQIPMGHLLMAMKSITH